MPRHQMVVAGIPTLGTVSAEWALYFRNLAWPTNTVIGVIMEKGKPVAEARNAIVKKAFGLETDKLEVSHIFWLDDDVLCNRDSLKALYTRRVPIVSGVYFTRSEVSEPLIYAGQLQGTEPFVPDKFLPVWGHGMGLTLVAMDVYRRMSEMRELGVDQYGNPQWYRTVNSETQSDDGCNKIMDASEDLYFCEAVSQIGIQSYVDTSRQAFGWHYDVEAQRAYPYKQWSEYQRTGVITWETPDGQVTWR